MSGSLWWRPCAWAPLGVAVLCATSLAAEVTLKQIALPPSPQPARASAPAPAYAPLATIRSVRVPEGTEVAVRLEEPLSSANASAGDIFSISTDEDIRLADGTVIPAGFRGKGEVTAAHKKEMLGKAGELAIRLDYVRIGDVRRHLRAVKSVEGKSTLTTTLVLTFVVTPLFLMHHGHEVVFPKGQRIVAYVDDDAVLPFPIARPPEGD